MKVAIIGGGPGGLYLAILVKKRLPHAEITVFERNARGVTFGWGVVFSDETLGNLHDADPESFEEIKRAFEHWTAIDTHYDGALLRSDGHGFSGLARRTLLAILETRALGLGVRVLYETEAPAAEALMAAHDLVVAADGVRSVTRGAFERDFGFSTTDHKCRYIWLGTSKHFDAFTFIFERNEHGIFQVHAYPFEKNTSTFIVECDEQTWVRAGLNHASERDSITYCERLFAKHLDGHPLQSNRSTWIQFLTVKNERWSKRNLVLLGDAAHTAHFSIGSGTKLAMEDSISLNAALSAHPTSVTEALATYEHERRPMVERIQRAAADSLSFFENTSRYWGVTPEEFAFVLMTRSKRITYDNLQLRDPAFVKRVSEDFCRRNDLPSDTPPMFAPFKIGPLQVVNRVVVSPMCMYSVTKSDGVVSDFHLVHYGSRAVGGAGLIITEMTDVAPDARITPSCAGLWSEQHAVAWRRIVDFVHEQSASKIAVQLGHAGRKGATCEPWNGGYDTPLATHHAWPLYAPSALKYRDDSQVPSAMTRDDMRRVTEQFVNATTLALQAGFDAIELHCAHGYLLASFLSPLTNVREDQYGGSPENRLRFPLEVFRAVRAAWPANKPVWVRISASDWVDGGTTIDDAVRYARAFSEQGASLIHVSSGQTDPRERPPYGRLWMAQLSDQIRRDAKVPTIAVGAISSADHVNTLVASGRADLVALARAHLADPYFTVHAAAAQNVSHYAWPAPYFAGKPQPPSKR
jgi:anthraniloyl-CoA monooxygenase